MNEKANYGNWVPEKALYMLFGAVIVLGVIAVAVQVALSEMVIAIIVGVLCILTLVMAIYMLICHEAFAFGKGNMMAGVHEHLIKHLDWDGEGKLLDIGCGAAALTVHCAKAFPKAQITAMDYWGVEWNYAKEQCEKNAKIEGVADHIAFQKGDAAKLDFPDETFDAVVSNFVFHEVRTAKDKRDVVKEALRVLKKGGVFSFQDMFSQKALYGDMEEFVRILKEEGIDDPVLFGAICAHNPKSGVKAKTKIQYALLAADPMSGFLKAVAQIYPDKKIASVKRKSVIKRFNEARFAKGANRDYMESIEFTGLMLEDLIDIGLEEMCAISDELGL